MKRVLRLPAYRRLLTAYALNELAWSVGTLALSVLVYRRTGSALGATAFFICSQVLPAFAGPPVVARLERHPPRLLLPVLYLVEGVAFGVLAWMTHRFSLVPVLVLSLIDGSIAAVARSFARAATVAELTPTGLLHEGNALSNGVSWVAYMGGPILGGAVVVAGGTVAALLADCGLFVIMGVILLATPLRPSASPAHHRAGRLRAALEQVRARPSLRRLLTLQGVGLVFFTISVPVEVVFAQHVLHAGAGGYGAMMAAWGAGALAGSAVYARWARASARILIAGSAASLGLGLGIMAVAPTIAVAVVGAALGGGSNGVEMVAARTAMQERTEPSWMALMTSLTESISLATPGLGILLGGAIAALFGARIALGVAAGGSFVFTAIAWWALSPVRFEPPITHAEPGAPGGGSAVADVPPTPVATRETLVP
jgi:MFS family permease